MTERPEEDVKAKHRRLKRPDEPDHQEDDPPGIELPAPSYTDDTGSTDLGVDEPVVPEPLRGGEIEDR
jgi:hypothetical protein